MGSQSASAASISLLPLLMLAVAMMLTVGVTMEVVAAVMTAAAVVATGKRQPRRCPQVGSPLATAVHRLPRLRSRQMNRCWRRGGSGGERWQGGAGLVAPLTPPWLHPRLLV